MKKELLELVEKYRAHEIKKWQDLPKQGAPQPIGYHFSFESFCEWLAAPKEQQEEDV